MKLLIFSLLFCASIYVSESRTDQFYEPDDALKAALKKEVSDLYDKISQEYDKIQGKITKINTLEKLVQFVAAINKAVNKDSSLSTKASDSPLGQVIVKLVQKLIDQGTVIFKNLLRKAQEGTYDTVPDPQKTTIIDLVANIYDEAKTAYRELVDKNNKANNKNQDLIQGLKAVVEIVKVIDTRLKSVPPTDLVGQVMQTGIERIIRQIVTVLEMDIKALTPRS